VNTTLPVKKRINYKAVLAVFGILAVMAVALHFLHRFQVRRNAANLRELATVMEKEDKLKEAKDFWNAYVGMMPEDTDALVQYGTLLDKTPAARGKTFSIFENVLRREPQRNDIRRRTAEIAMLIRRYPDAMEHLKKLRDANPEDTEVLQLMATCFFFEQKPKEAEELFLLALSKGSNRLELFLEFAKFLRIQRADGLADDQIDAMVVANPTLPRARIEAAKYYSQYKDWDKAEKNARAALYDFHAQDAEVFVYAIDAATFGGRKKEAADYLQRAEKLYPNNPDIARRRVRMDLASGNVPQAIDHIPKAAPDATPRELYVIADLLVDLHQPEQAREMIKKYRDKGIPMAGDFLEGRLAMQLGNWAEARRLLEGVRNNRGLPADIIMETNLLLATCYDEQGNLDLELEACNQALLKFPRLPRARAALASCYAAMGKTDDAIREYKFLVNESTPGARIRLIRLLLAQTVSRPLADQKWDEIEALFRGMPAEQSAQPATQLLRADVYIAQRKYDEARKVAETVRDQDPKQGAAWLSLLKINLVEGQPEKTRQVLDEAERATGKHADWTLARLRMDSRFEKPAEFKKLLQQAEQGLSQYAAADQARVLAGLAEDYFMLGDRPAALRLWQDVAARLPNDAGVRFRLLETTIALKREAEARRWLDEIKRIEGPKGALSQYGEAALLVMKAENGDKSALASAREHLAKAAGARPSWSRVPLLEAAMFEMEGQKDRALEKYQAALDRGEKRVGIIQHVVRLYHEKGRYTEARALVTTLPEAALATAGLKRMAAELDLLDPAANKNQDPVAIRARALDMARKAVSDKKADYNDYIWLGLMAAAAERPEEAEKALRQAVSMKPDSAEAWVHLVSLLARSEPQKAEVELRNAQKALPVEQGYLVLAVGYEAVGKTDFAAENYQAALKMRPNDLGLLRNAASFYSRNGQVGKAIELLRKVIEPGSGATEPIVAWARRTLALGLAGGGTFRQFQEAQDLLDKNTKQFGDTEEDRRTRALVLATQPKYRTEAIQQFEKLSVKNNLAPEHRFLLAQLYEAEGNWQTAKWQMQALVRDHENNPYVRARLAGLLLRHKLADEAYPHVQRLVQLRPSALETAALLTRVLKEKGKAEEALTAARNFAGAGNPPDQAAYLFEELGEKNEAEKSFRAFVAAAPDKPERSLVLAAFLGRIHRTDEALEICDKAWEKCQPEAVTLTVLEVMRSGQFSDSQERQVDSRLREAIAKSKTKNTLVQLRAQFREYTGHPEESVELYREVLKTQPKNVPALNNLAVLLALSGRSGEEALQHINAAIDFAGPRAELLDTRAMVYLSQHRPELALKDLDEAIKQVPSPLYFFHQARAYAMSSDRRQAYQCWQKATREGGLTASALPREERAAFEALSKQMAGS
jgi:cellulose synthase operon protein C